jgi:hypothetical protein
MNLENNQIALPDSYSSAKSLKTVLNKQGYGLQDLSLVQPVRLIDVFVIAPVLIYASTKIDNKLLKSSVFIIGLSTLIYNGYNYLNNIKK